MYARKLLSLVSTAVFAVVMLAGCGGSNFSSAAVKAANKAQSTVVFETDARLTNSLQDALEASADPTAIRQAMVEDDNMDELLKSGYRLDVLTVGGSDGDAAADALAEYIKTIVSGREKEGYISLVKADNGSFYAAILTYRNGGSGGGSGSGGGTTGGDSGEQGGSGEGGDNSGGTTDPDNPDGGDIDDENTQHAVTVTWTGNGSVTSDSGSITSGTPIQVDDGNKITFTFTPDNGWYVSDVKVDGTSQENKENYTIANVDDDVTIEVTFSEITVTGIDITKNPDRLIYQEGEEFDPTGMEVTISYSDGSSKVVTVEEFRENNISYNEDNGTVTVSCEEFTDTVDLTINTKQYIVTVLNKGEKGKISITDKEGEFGHNDFSGDTFVDAGSDFNFKATPDEGYEVYSVTVERKGGHGIETLALAEKYTVSNIQSDVIITVTFAEKKAETYSVTTTTSGDGKGTINAGNKATAGKDFNFTVTAGKGSTLGEVTVTDEDGHKIDYTTSGSTYTIEGDDIKSNITITANFELTTFYISVQIEGNGKVEVDNTEYKDNSSISVKYGEEITLKFDAGHDQRVKDVIVDDAPQGAKKNYTFSDVTEDHSIKVVFKAQPVVEDIEIDSDSWNTFKKSYWCYEDLDDVTQLEIKVTYNKESGEPEKTIPVTADMVKHVCTKYEWPTLTSDAYWRATFQITYGGKSTTFDVRVDCWVGPDIVCDYCEHWNGKNGKTHGK